MDKSASTVRPRELHDKKRSELCFFVAQKTIEAFTDHRGFVNPPVPVEELVSWLGFQIVPLFTVTDEFSALVSTRDKLIGVNGRHHRHRQRFSLCHELAHILLKHPPEVDCSPRQIAHYNSEADECAAELLIPHGLLAEWITITRNVGELARIFDVSEEAMALKLKQWDSKM